MAPIGAVVGAAMPTAAAPPLGRVRTEPSETGEREIATARRRTPQKERPRGATNRRATTPRRNRAAVTLAVSAKEDARLPSLDAPDAPRPFCFPPLVWMHHGPRAHKTYHNVPQRTTRTRRTTRTQNVPQRTATDDNGRQQRTTTTYDNVRQRTTTDDNGPQQQTTTDGPWP